MPPPLAVRAAQALLAVQRLAGADGGAVGPADLLGVLLRYGVEEGDPCAVAGVLAPDAVAVVGLAIGPGCPDALGHRVSEDAEAHLAALLQFSHVERPH